MLIEQKVVDGEPKAQWRVYLDFLQLTYSAQMQIAIHNHVTYPSSFIFYFLSKHLKDIALIHLDWNVIYVPSVANCFLVFF